MKNVKFLPILFLFNFCFGGTTDPSVADKKYLDYGKEFYFVARVVGEHENYYASAVLLNKNTFITSGHVAKKIKKIIVQNKKNYEFDIKEINIHKDYKEGARDNDLAMGKIKENFNLDFYPELYKDKDELGQVVSICGYGSTGTFLTGKTKSDKMRRAGSNVVDSVCGNILFCSALDKRKTDLEFLICHGDSGGGLFINNKVAGVNCFINAKDGTYNSDYDDDCGHVRISQHLDWIEKYMKD